MAARLAGRGAPAGPTWRRLLSTGRGGGGAGSGGGSLAPSTGQGDVQVGLAGGRLQEVGWRIGRLLDSATGYEKLEKVKSDVSVLSAAFEDSRRALRTTKEAFADAAEAKGNVQSDINSLLQRKSTWTADDVRRFTELTSMEHRAGQLELETRRAMMEQERDFEALHNRFIDALRERYTVEQLFSEKSRQLSTYGTWALICANTALFAISALVVEPYKRAATERRIGAAVIAEGEATVRGVAEAVARELDRRGAGGGGGGGPGAGAGAVAETVARELDRRGPGGGGRGGGGEGESGAFMTRTDVTAQAVLSGAVAGLVVVVLTGLASR